MNTIREIINDPAGFLLSTIVILLALTFHEFAHGYAAYKMGDPTAKKMGRLSLNPFAHIDPVGFICMLFLHFGWAKPVQVNSRYFKHPKTGMAITALAGPVSNLLMSFIGIIGTNVMLTLCQNDIIKINSNFTYNVVSLIIQFFQYVALINISLGLFNLIPVPPLDGSRVLFVVLPEKYYFGLMQYERYIQIGLFVLLWTGLLNRPLNVATRFVYDVFSRLVGLIPFFA